MKQDDGFWRSLLRTVSRNPISFFAVLCVSCTAAFLGYLSDRQLYVLESPQWCSKALLAERISPGTTFKGLESCLELLKSQINAIAIGFHIGLGAYALTLIVLVVVVIAGARASGKLGSGGMEFNVGRDPKKEAEAAAEHVVAGAKKAEDEVIEGSAPAAEEQGT